MNNWAVNTRGCVYRIIVDLMEEVTFEPIHELGSYWLDDLLINCSMPGTKLIFHHIKFPHASF
jgi:hypothetical protein